VRSNAVTWSALHLLPGRMNAIAAAAKKRAEKLGIQNQEVDDSNVGKADDPGDLSHPFFGESRGGMALAPA